MTTYPLNPDQCMALSRVLFGYKVWSQTYLNDVRDTGMTALTKTVSEVNARLFREDEPLNLSALDHFAVESALVWALDTTQRQENFAAYGEVVTLFRVLECQL